MAEVIHKTELTKLVAGRLGVSQASAAEATAAVLDSLEQALTENDRVTLVGFGTFP
jgi:DNA-binding protein HU-beta